MLLLVGNSHIAWWVNVIIRKNKDSKKPIPLIKPGKIPACVDGAFYHA